MLKPLFTGYFLFLSVSLFAQAPTDARVSFRGDTLSFEAFVRSVEQQTKLRFYFNPAQTEQIRVTLHAQNAQLNEVLTNLLRPYSLQHHALPNGQVVITSEKTGMVTKLTPDFFWGIPQRQTFVDTGSATGRNTARLSQGLDNKLIEIGSAAKAGTARVTLSGFIRELKTGQAIAGTGISADPGQVTVLSDAFGYYSMSLSPGRYTLFISGTGMKTSKREISIHENGRLDVDLVENIPTLKAVTIVAEKNSNIRRMQMGVDQLSIKSIKKVPVLMGEPDVLRAVMALPGVTTVSEASTGFNVRGGNADQNLILYNDATIYNPSHLFGFFSAFNPDAVKGVELFKSSIPVRYGGRLSSVLDVSGKEGNAKVWSGNGGISPLFSKITVEGPLVKDRTRLLLGGRTTYSNWVLKQIEDPSFQNSSASFGDVDFHLSHDLGPSDKLDFTGYFSTDAFSLSNDTLFRYGNRNLVMRWRHQLNNRLNMTLSGGWDNYRYQVTGDKETQNGFRLSYNINQLHAKAHFVFTPSNKHLIDFGYQGILYNLKPGQLEPYDFQSQIKAVELEPDKGLEQAFYFSDRIHLNRSLALDLGLRYSIFTSLGPKTVLNYVPGVPKDPGSVNDTLSFGAGQPVKTYHGPEWRLSLRYSVGEHASIKASFNSTRQYIHQLSNTAAISPTDIWKLSDYHIRPQLGQQVSLGYYLDLKSGMYETSLEIYYKRSQQVLDFKSGASLLLNPNLEADVINTRGEAYGVEAYVKKTTGKLTGWLSYTYSRSFLQMDDSLAGQVVNKGRKYPANYDKPHVFNLITNYRFTLRHSFSANVVYSSGRPITIPVALFSYAGTQRVYYSDRNQFRIPDYFRIDLSVTLDGNHRVKQKIHNSWTIGVYNLTGRDNPYSVYFTEENGSIRGYQLSVIGNLVPYITYNFKF